MKILFICSVADWHMRHWLKYWSKQHQVYIFSDNVINSRVEDFQDLVGIEIATGLFDGILNTFQIKSKFLIKINKFVSSYRYAKKIALLSKELNIDFVHAHSLFYGLITFFVNKKIPVIFTPMGSDVILHAQKNLIYRLMALAAFKRADIVTGDSFLLRDKGLKVGAKLKHNYIIQNGVDAEIFYPRPNNLRHKYLIKDDESLIFSPRSIAAIYNIDIIIQAIAVLSKRNIRVRCMFTYAFGDEYYLGLKRLAEMLGIQDQLIWLGFVNEYEMAELYNASNLVVSVPSSDSSPKSVYEAIFCNKPVIVSNLQWSYEYFDPKENYPLRVTPRDPHALADAIQFYIHNPTVSNEHAKNAKNKAKDIFDYTQNMSRLERILIDYKSDYFLH